MTRKKSAVLLKSVLSKSVISLDTMDRAIRGNQQVVCAKTCTFDKKTTGT
ncbi:hypothetical protein [Candidatus Thioglobus sp.]|jgi:hypothetical protein|nr:hypothetical protein [Candidatus Thioglobus sp.]MBT3186667.1 hypothetical protein [Candidatus Thioglobus sp.]MBT4553142.1 hypothetical protein [Candidatus Thioglobus sp.]MBT7498606.1 hypothetical protein [Candidatus Thioglobus sp.]